MKVIVGLGNPGSEYANTRHNVGVVFVERLAASVQRSDYGWRRRDGIYVYESSGLILVKPADVFMNESGKMMRLLDARRYDLDAIYVAHDDLDIKLGEYKVQRGKGPKEHNGVLSVEQALGTRDFWRIRIGIENRDQEIENKIKGEEYVLQRFSEEEKKIVDNVLDEIVKTVIGGEEPGRQE